ncbi:hypothetical protein GGI00_005576, partial [Coemansia sp. RSA 2681]
CWPMLGSSGQVAIHLSQPVDISDFAIEHVAKSVAIDWRSAPRQIEVWGYVFGSDNSSSSSSNSSVVGAARVQTLVLKVKSNWGHPGHTCLYRFRVHGHRAAPLAESAAAP